MYFRDCFKRARKNPERDSERISEIVQQLIVFDEEEESLIVNDIVEDHYEFFTRIDQPKEKIVFYINDLNFE